MYRLGQVELIYIHQTKDENYNPIVERYSKIVKCQLMDSFSVNYYSNQTRDMRKARNIIVAKPHTFDLYIDEKRYQLESVKLNGLRYNVTNILKDRSSSLNMILDCQEVINE